MITETHGYSCSVRVTGQERGDAPDGVLAIDETLWLDRVSMNLEIRTQAAAGSDPRLVFTSEREMHSVLEGALEDLNRVLFVHESPVFYRVVVRTEMTPYLAVVPT